MSDDRKKTVLVIDDDLSIRKLMDKILQKRGFTVYLAETGREGLKLLKNQLSRLSLVILDYTIMDMSCEDICMKIKEEAPGLPMVIMSGQDSNLVKEKTSFCPNIKATLCKPFTIEKLMNSVNKALNERESNE